MADTAPAAGGEGGAELVAPASRSDRRPRRRSTTLSDMDEFPFDLLETIGRGAFSTVMRAVHRLSKEEVSTSSSYY